MRTTTFIYTLSCPLSGDVRYVGKSNKPNARFSKHKQMSDNNKSKNSWINELLTTGLCPVLTIVEEVPISEWKFMEKLYITKFKELGCELLNICSGANGSEFGNKTSFDGRNARKIVSLFKDGIYNKTFDSIKDARSDYGSGINSVLHGVTKTAYGFIWLYEDVYNKLSPDELRNIVENATNNMSKLSWKNGLIKYQFKRGDVSLNTKKVHQYTLDGQFIKTWESVMGATLSLCGKDKQSHISMAAAGTRKTSLGFKWSYILL